MFESEIMNYIAFVIGAVVVIWVGNMFLSDYIDNRAAREIKREDDEKKAAQKKIQKAIQ
jgi:arginine exporter protein ArgO